VKAPHPLLTPRRSPPQKWTVRIVRNSDKAFVDCEDGLLWEDGDMLRSLLEGGYACDCNRHLMFANARGEDINGSPECGTGVYSIPRAVGEDGTVLEVEGGQ
jgi:hypothetical protein